MNCPEPSLISLTVSGIVAVEKELSLLNIALNLQLGQGFIIHKTVPTSELILC